MTVQSSSTHNTMNRHAILPTLVLALAFSVQPLNAAKKKTPPATVPGNSSSEMPLDTKSQARVKRAHHLAEKSANNEFLNSPQGIAFKKQISDWEQEINGTYEKYLNLFREDLASEKGKTMREERDRQLQLLNQKLKKAEADYEALKKTSPTYRAMLEKHLKSELKQVKGKLKSQAPVEEDGDK